MTKLMHSGLARGAAAGLISCGLMFSTAAFGGTNAQSGQPANDRMGNASPAPAGATDDKHWRRQDELATQKIRQAVEHDKGLSFRAKNVKIITRHGQVTLQGTVRTDDEKQKIAADATGVVGAEKVTDQVVVKGKK